MKKGVRLERKDLMARNSQAGALKTNFEGKNPTVLQCKRMRSKYEINDPTIVWKPANYTNLILPSLRSLFRT